MLIIQYMYFFFIDKCGHLYIHHDGDRIHLGIVLCF